MHNYYLFIHSELIYLAYRAVKSDGPMESPVGSGGKILGRKEKKQKQSELSDIGVTNMDQVLAQAVGGERSIEDSFERYYNKDLDLDEGIIYFIIN